MLNKRLLTLALPVLFSLSSYAQNVLKNPGFEESDGWNNWGGIQDKNPHAGTYSLKIQNEEFKWSGSDQIIIMPQGIKKMTLAGWMKVSNVEKGQNAWETARIAVEFYDADNRVTGGYPDAAAQGKGTSDWQRYERTYLVPKDAKTAKIQLALGNAKGTVWFDDLEVYLIGEGDTKLQAGKIETEAMKPEDYIRINQVGYYPNGPKIAVVVEPKTDKFFVINAASKKDTVFKGSLVKKGTWKPSGENVSHADFSSVTKPGKYVIVVPGIATSYPFEIKNKVLHNVGKASLKTFYYQRTLIDLEEQYAGQWKRKAGHPDNAVIIHSSAVSEGRPEGSKISSQRGWYDAGDYNKYIVNSGISTYTLLAAYEHYPAFFDTLKVNIPESDNKIPDLLDESLWNVRWMLTMQDPADGGVYHKLSNANFDGEVMPDKATEPRYVVMKSTAAALDFTAVMAQSYRIFKKFDKQLPGFADSCLTAAKKAYAWAKKNPEIYYVQEEMNKKFKPSIVTGEYGDGNVKDEFQWAAIELFASTGDAAFYKEANIATTLDKFDIPAWPEVNTLGLITLVNLKDKEIADAAAIKARIIKLADDLKNHAAASEFGTPMGIKTDNFIWGSNSFAANQGIILMQAYRITGKKEYLNAALANLDYILGRNGTGYSYVSAFGTKYMKKPHHRPCQADGIKDVIPGFLSGGPNTGQQDKQGCAMPYPSDLPAKSYLDEECSYASNEVAINWNSPLTYLMFAIEASMGEKK
ncbi:MAG: glycoside hydrolase family 9 protein [Cytophagaceae bacterium]